MSANRITILHDSFGKHANLRKEWGFSALVEKGMDASLAAVHLTASENDVAVAAYAAMVGAGSDPLVSNPIVTSGPRSGVITRLVQPSPACTVPLGDATVSSARTTVVPIATTRPPQRRVASTSRAVDAGTR